MSRFEVEVVVKEVRGCCAAYYKPGSSFVVRELYTGKSEDKDMLTRVKLHVNPPDAPPKGCFGEGSWDGINGRYLICSVP